MLVVLEAVTVDLLSDTFMEKDFKIGLPKLKLLSSKINVIFVKIVVYSS